MAAAFQKFNAFTQDLARKVHDLGADNIYLMLTNTAPSAANAVKADITEIAAGNGYTANGLQCPVTSCTQTGGVLKLVLSNPGAWTASGGSIGPFRYAVLYNATPVSKPLIGFYDYGSAVTLAAGEQFQGTFDATNGVLTIT